MLRWKGRWVVIGIILLIDIYVFSVLQSVAAHSSSNIRTIVYSMYWVVSLLAVSVIIIFPYVKLFRRHILIRNYVFAILMGLFIAEITSSVFFILDDIRRGVVWVFGKSFPGTAADFIQQDGTISRSAILTWLGFLLGGGIFVLLIYGFTNKYNYRVKHIKLSFKNLPAAFKGLKIAHITDIHSGSFQNKKAVNKGVDLLLAQHADLVLFTGDIVNDRAEELEGYMDIFSRVKAPLGVFSIMGNHDYGDYHVWPDRDEAHREAEKAAGRRLPTPTQKANIEKLKQMHATMGWRLLMNEHVAIEKGGQRIALLGIENWSAKGNFPKYGKMADAYKGTEQYPFKILMSHDPSHWNAEVRPGYPGIDLMLSGHTHGMQFGINLPFFKWSPVKWIYKEWAGLYEQDSQKLYVSSGFGFLGYPGRVGILPEITIIELV